jgi:hypothetical protein
MNFRLQKTLFLLVWAGAGLFVGCIGPNRVASGGGTETVIGSIVHEDGKAAWNTVVRLYPADYNPGGTPVQVPADTTSDSGKYSFSNVSAGAYTITAFNPEKSTRALVCDITVGEKDVAVPAATLHVPGTIKIVLPDSVDTATGYVYIPGTGITKKVTTAAGVVVLDSVPSGTIPSILYNVTSDSSQIKVFRNNIPVTPNDTTTILYSGWRFANNIYINTAASGAGVTGNVTGFPLLVRLDSVNFDFGSAKPDGSDLRFAKNNGTPLPYQVERWNSGLKQAEIWVRMDTVYGNDSAQSFQMCWGNTSAASQSSGTAVFDTLGGFMGAWHFEETGTIPRSNSAQNKYAAVPGNFTGFKHTAGIIGEADSLNGIDNFYSLDSGMADWSGGITYSVWAYPTAVRECAAFMDFGNGAPGDNILFTRLNSTDQLSVQIYDGSNDGGKLGAPSIALNQWQHFAFSVTGNNVKIYRDGALILSDTSAQMIRTIVRTKNFFGKNDWAVPGNSYYQGILDEIELSNVERSADWLKLSYETQRENSTVCKIR